MHPAVNRGKETNPDFLVVMNVGPILLSFLAEALLKLNCLIMRQPAAAADGDAKAGLTGCQAARAGQ